MKKYFLFGLVIISFASCKKTYVSNLSFDVTTASATYKVGDTISFRFSGNADNITFYPGTSGYVYANRGRVSESGKPVLQFYSLKELNTVDTSLFLMASTDFNGVYDSLNISSGNWIDITSRAKLSTGFKDTVNSGEIDLSDFAALQKPLFLAFKYMGTSSPTLAQSRWTVNRFLLTNNLSDSTKQVVASQSEVTFVGINVKNYTNRWSVNASQIQIRGGAKADPENEDWVISKPLKLDRAKPDIGYVVKSISSGIDSYSIPNNTFKGYLAPGKYRVTFVATNKTAFKDESIVKELEITIEP